VVVERPAQATRPDGGGGLTADEERSLCTPFAWPRAHPSRAPPASDTIAKQATTHQYLIPNISFDYAYRRDAGVALRIDEWAARRRRSSDRGRHGRARSRRSRRRGAAQLPRAHRVELLDEVNPALAVADVDRVPDKRGRRKPKIALDLKPNMTTDSLQLFMKGIGKVRPLSAQD
jgi:hypothetical protein